MAGGSEGRGRHGEFEDFGAANLMLPSSEDAKTVGASQRAGIRVLGSSIPVSEQNTGECHHSTEGNK